WCPRCRTALSNEEAEHRDVEGKLYHLKYPLAETPGKWVVVATTRPETMLGDTAVAVHPDDERHGDVVGREVNLPLTGRRIPIIADRYVDPEFGSGFVKITPAHDPNDFEVGVRHELPSIDVMNDDASMSDEAPEAYRGLDRFEARERVVADLEAAGLLAKVEDHQHAVGHCYRCGTAVEPRLSLQWFVKMKPLAEPALAAYREGRLRFHPQRYGATYEHWLTNVRDWCISRQLWWGHRIPVWYCDGCGEVTVGREDPDACPSCAGELRQDPDVLDTWFSSWLWPFSTLGWPEKTPDLAALYPTSVLSTAPEILFFWVARMVMAGLEFMGELPFADVLMHGTVRDTAGRKMSKSLGNGIDPLEVVDEFGADAMRFTLVSAAAIGTDMQLDHTDLEGAFKVGRNFANKIWNAVRFALSELETADMVRSPAETRLEVADRWILSRFGSASRGLTGDLDRFRLHEAAERTYQFVWGDFCDWYLELAKPRLRGDRGTESRDAAATTLAFVLDGWLRLLHPVMPFITEELFCHLPGRDSEDTLLSGPWPTGGDIETWEDSTAAMGELQELVGTVRNLRSEYGIDPGRKVELVVSGVSDPLQRALSEEEAGALSLARLSSLSTATAIPSGVPGAHAVLRSGTEIFLPLEGIVDLDRERERITEELVRLEGLLKSAAGKLANPGFTEGAPAEVVEREREKVRSFEQRLERLLEKREAFLMNGG
ncbi:MAG: valine--tRNA ligase, partial [Gemmatimonadota bacterium]